MKTLFITLITFSFSFTAWAQSGTVTTSIKVFGNCTMCKSRIEKVLDYKGIKKATWNTQTKQLNVVYNASKISEQKIHELVASAGHDTDKVKAKDEMYATLPFCCLYRDHDHH
ncbi:MAG: heavy-metal-associated domain-containing protein [Flammeovirgaceae bacterium]